MFQLSMVELVNNHIAKLSLQLGKSINISSNQFGIEHEVKF